LYITDDSVAAFNRTVHAQPTKKKGRGKKGKKGKKDSAGAGCKGIYYALYDSIHYISLYWVTPGLPL
jgi:hypothetical protein